MRSIFGPLELAPPEDWSDQSIISFAGRPLAPVTRAVSGTKEIRPSVIVRYVLLSESGLALDDYAALQEQLLLDATPGLELIARGDATATAEETPAKTLELRWPGGQVRQYYLFFVLGAYFVVLCGSGPDDVRFENTRESFLELAASISLRRV